MQAIEYLLTYQYAGSLIITLTLQKVRENVIMYKASNVHVCHIRVSD